VMKDRETFFFSVVVIIYSPPMPSNFLNARFRAHTNYTFEGEENEEVVAMPFECLFFDLEPTVKCRCLLFQ